MLRKLLIPVFCCLAIAASAQEGDTISKWSVGVNAFRYTRMYFDTRAIPELLPGIIIKRKYKHYALRMGLEYEQQELDSPSDECCDQIQKDGKNDVFSLRFGIERPLIRIHSFRAYAALDLQLSYIHSNYMETGGLAPYYFRQISDVFLMGFDPTVGIGYSITPKMALNVETRVLIAGDRANYKTSSSTQYAPYSMGYKNEFGIMYRDFISAVTLNIRL